MSHNPVIFKHSIKYLREALIEETEIQMTFLIIDKLKELEERIKKLEETPK